MGIKAFRTSISWARIFPHGDDGRPNELGLAFYERMVDCLLAHGIEPVITLSHYETPLELLFKYGGHEIPDKVIQDPDRTWYLKQHLAQVSEAIHDGCNVVGYLWWGPMDIVSAGTGEMRKRYGFIYVDRHNDGSGDLHRAPKASYWQYKRIIEDGGFTIET